MERPYKETTPNDCETMDTNADFSCVAYCVLTDDCLAAKLAALAKTTLLERAISSRLSRDISRQVQTSATLCYDRPSPPPQFKVCSLCCRSYEHPLAKNVHGLCLCEEVGYCSRKCCELDWEQRHSKTCQWKLKTTYRNAAKEASWMARKTKLGKTKTEDEEAEETLEEAAAGAAVVPWEPTPLRILPNGHEDDMCWECESESAVLFCNRCLKFYCSVGCWQSRGRCFQGKCRKLVKTPCSECGAGCSFCHCSRCNRPDLASYCNRECQVKHWKTHRKECGKSPSQSSKQQPKKGGSNHGRFDVTALVLVEHRLLMLEEERKMLSKVNEQMSKFSQDLSRDHQHWLEADVVEAPPANYRICGFCFHPYDGLSEEVQGMCECFEVGYCSWKCCTIDWKRRHHRTCQWRLKGLQGIAATEAARRAADMARDRNVAETDWLGTVEETEWVEAHYQPSQRVW